jgi:hypothetical protein
MHNAQHPSQRPWLVVVACLPLVLTLSACGGGNHTVDPNLVPVATTTEFTNFVATRTPDEAADPIEVEDVVPPTSETDEPRDVT